MPPVDTATAKAGELGAQQIGTVTDDITTAVPLDASGNPQRSADGTWRRDDRGRESTLSNMIAQSYVDSLAAKKVANADIGVMNPGGVRAELYQDEDGITFREAANIMPFNNIVKTIDVTGATFKEILEQQWQPGSSRPFLALGLSERVTYTYDPYAPQGSHVTSIMLDGKPMDMGKTYTVASNNFLLAGGDSFTTLGDATMTDTGFLDRDVTAEYLKAEQPLSASYTKRQVGESVSTDSATGEATVGLTGLLFTPASEQAASGAAKSVSALVPTTEGDTMTLATADVDGAVTAGLPETGKATLSFTLPADAATQACSTSTSSNITLCATVTLAVTSNGGDTTGTYAVEVPVPDSATTEPTASPTTEPTASPTTESTSTPTAQPSASSTAAPTVQPTARPTVQPTPGAGSNGFVEGFVSFLKHVIRHIGHWIGLLWPGL